MTSVTEVDHQLTDIIAMTIPHHITITTEITHQGHVEAEEVTTVEVTTLLHAEVVTIMEVTLKVEAANETNFQITLLIYLPRMTPWRPGNEKKNMSLQFGSFSQ